MGEKKKKRKRKESEEGVGERSSTFSLVFMAIAPSVSVGARGKVPPLVKRFK